jgi:hypothetical protein
MVRAAGFEPAIPTLLISEFLTAENQLVKK